MLRRSKTRSFVGPLSGPNKLFKRDLVLQEEEEWKEALEAAGGELLSEAGSGVQGIRVGDWCIRSTKRAILNSEGRDQWEDKLGTRHLPEMVFGRNLLELHHQKSGVCLFFNAFDALTEWKRENLPPVEVSAAAKWKFRSKPDEQVILDYDYTFTTPYCGGQCLAEKEPAGQSDAQTIIEWVPCTERIDFVSLQARDPILFYDEVILYEDELSDNGISFLSVKVRVMPTCWFLLLRFWLRVDGVLMRLRDTRMFCSYQDLDDKQMPVVIRDVCHREDTFEALRSRGCVLDSVMFQDPNAVADLLQVQSQRYEKLVTKAKSAAA